MTFEHDFFISYAHLDNPRLGGRDGWVNSLHELLEARVGQYLGAAPNVWRDPKLKGNDIFDDEIRSRLAVSAALISVVTPRYVQSDSCREELQEFCRAVQLSGGLRVANKARLFPVVKTRVPRGSLPEAFHPVLAYEFFTPDKQSGRDKEMAWVRPAVDDPDFMARLDDLAFDIAQVLETLRRDGPAPAPKGVVYLAETSFDLRDQRDAIRRDLVRNGYEVLPDRRLPLLASDFDTIAREQLSRSQLCIHLIGRNYAVVTEGAGESMVARQQILASQCGIPSIIWLPAGLVVEDPRQQALIKRLREDPDVHRTAELFEAPIERLKTLIHQKLAPPQRAVRREAPRGLKTIYLLCDQPDVEATRPLDDYMYGRGFEVRLPVFVEDEAEARAEHEELLRTCDAMLIYYASPGPMWLRQKLRDVEKSAGLLREPWLARAIYAAPPFEAWKDRFRTHAAMQLREPASGFDPAVLEPFLQEIENFQEEAS